MSRKNVKVIRDYLDFEDLIKKSGYKVYKPKIGSVGRALIKASKSSGTANTRYAGVRFSELVSKTEFPEESVTDKILIL